MAEAEAEADEADEAQPHLVVVVVVPEGNSMGSRASPRNCMQCSYDGCTGALGIGAPIGRQGDQRVVAGGDGAATRRRRAQRAAHHNFSLLM